MSSQVQAVKVAVVVDSALPSGLAANTAAVLALTLGRRIETIIGPDVKDADGNIHIGITTIPIPILVSDSEKIRAIRSAAIDSGGEIMLIDFTDCAQRTRTYDEYTRLLGDTTDSNIQYIGIALYGPPKLVNKLTGSLPLLR